MYAVGKVLHEMTQPRAEAEAQPAGADGSLARLGPGWEQLLAIISRACAPTPKERFASAQAMREALLAVAMGRVE